MKFPSGNNKLWFISETENKVAPLGFKISGFATQNETAVVDQWSFFGIECWLKTPRTYGFANRKLGHRLMHNSVKKLSWWSALLGLVLAITAFSTWATAQDDSQQDDPPGRVARLGYMEGSVSFQLAGEQDWVGAAN